MSEERVKPTDVDWNEIYDGEHLWSGHVNGSLAAEAADLAAGAALDIGCGEGADAIWLAEHGWDVTAIDIAPTAIGRARAEAAARGLHVDCRAIDVLASPTTLGAFELVSLHYPAFDIAALSEVIELLRAATKVGGTALIVGHAPPEDPAAISFDPTDWVQPDDIAAAVAHSSDWAIETHERRDREGEHLADSPHQVDVILRLRRLPSS